ncbi:hypothetical protein ACGF0J_20585 [Nonomuraea sp. NPDC047897]|jgi:hypothetical protein|uniref:hypothetical protein n=1 Tax=Nonomuraea sp. NPDC047897 TaxID=3364346 RepID=UPI003718DE63
MKWWTSSDRAAGVSPVRRVAGLLGRHLWTGLQSIGRVGFADPWPTDDKEDPR